MREPRRRSPDGDVQYRDCRAANHVNSFGGSLSGQRNTGIVEVITRASKVDLRQNTGDVRIQGDGLELSLNDIGGDIYVQVTGSKVGIEGTAGPLQISNDYGDTVVSRSSGKIQVKSRNGDVRVLDLAGSVEIEADGPLVEVRWTSLPSDRDSAITNDGGDVAVVLPSGMIGRLEAKTRYGRITADSPRVQLTDDGTRAVAIFGRAQRPVIRIEASGDLTLSGGGAGERPKGEHP